MDVEFSSKDNSECLQPFARPRESVGVHSRRNYCKFTSAGCHTSRSPLCIPRCSSNRTDKLPTNHRAPLVYQSVKTFVRRKFYCERAAHVVFARECHARPRENCGDSFAIVNSRSLQSRPYEKFRINPDSANTAWFRTRRTRIYLYIFASRV